MSDFILSCFTNSYGRFGGDAAIELLPSAGITHVELPIRTAGTPGFFGDEPLITTASTPEQIEAVKQRMADAGLTVSTCNITSGNPLDEHVLTITKQKLDIASAFGVKWVVANAGEASSEVQSVRLFDHLRQIGDHASWLGITYCCEVHPGVCSHPDGMIATMKELDHPQIKLNFDTGNVLYYNEAVDCLKALEQVREFVAHVHLKDSNGIPKDWHFPALGDGGAVDFRGVKAILDEAGFDGPYSIEIEGIEGEPAVSKEGCQNRIVKSVEHLRNCGYFGDVT